MTQELFDQLDDYIEALFIGEDTALAECLKATEQAGLPAIQISPGQGKMLHLFAKMIGARRILEIGTLGGYSAIWLARALPADGKLVSLEFYGGHAELARRNIDRAGLADRVEVLTGDAHRTLAGLTRDGAAPFDMVFLDAEKHGYPAYLAEIEPLTKSGTLILADNVIRQGQVLDPQDPDAAGAAAFNEALAKAPWLEAVIMQQIGVKGHDGLALARVL